MGDFKNRIDESVLAEWDITATEFTDIIRENPSIRGMVFGYVAEYKLRKIWFKDRPGVSHFVKHDDHNRKKKGDLVVTYKGREFSFECKSVQTNTVQRTDNGGFFAKVQCDGSDRRLVSFPDGTTLQTTCLLRGQFDILAVSLFQFEKTWRFIFAKNKDLPPNTYRKYTPNQQALLLPSLMPVSWPLAVPYRDEPFSLMDELIAENHG